MDLDFYFPVGSYLYSECASFLCGLSSIDSAVEKISSVDIQKIRRMWLNSVSPQRGHEFSAYLKAVKKSTMT